MTIDDKDINSILIKLQTIIPDCILRIKVINPGIIDGTNYYICGYDSDNDISIRITFTDINKSKSCLYEIEYKGSCILRKNSPTIKFDNYFYIIENLIDLSKQVKQQCKAFPELPINDLRNKTINNLID